MRALHIFVAGLLASQFLCHTALSKDTVQIADIPIKTLLEKVDATAAARNAIVARRDELMDRIGPVTSDLEAQLVERQTLVLPDPPAMDRTPATPDAAQALIDAWGTRAERIEALKTLTRNWAGLATQHRKITLLLVQEATLLLGDHSPTQALLDELKQRIAAGTAKADAVPPLLRAPPDWTTPAKLTTAITVWRGLAERDQVQIRQAEDDLKHLEEATAAAKDGIETATGWLQDATERAALRTEFRPRDPADLTGLFGLAKAEAETRTGELRDRLDGVKGQTAALTQARTSFDALTPPRPEDVAADDGPPIESLRRARANLTLAERTLAFQEQRLNQLAAITAQTNALQQAIADGITAVQALLKSRIELEVMAEILAQPVTGTGAGTGTGFSHDQPAAAPAASTTAPPARPAKANSRKEQQPTAKGPRLDNQIYSAETAPAGGSGNGRVSGNGSGSGNGRGNGSDHPAAAIPGDLTAATVMARQWLDELRAQARGLEAETSRLTDARPKIDALIGETRKAIDEQTRTVERESRWATFIAAVEALDADQLLATFEKAVQAVENTRGLLEPIAAEAEASAKAVETAAVALAAHRDPVMLSRSTDQSGFDEWISLQGVRLAEPENGGGQAEPAAANTSPESTGAAAAQGSTAEAAPAPQTASPGQPRSRVETWLTEARGFRDQTINRRLSYYQDRAKTHEALTTALRQHRDRLLNQIDSTETALEAARRAWGSATTLKARSALGQMNPDGLAARIEPWLERQPVIALQDQLQAMNRHLQSIAAQEEGSRAAVFQAALTAPLAAWSDQLSQTAERFTDYLSLREQFAAIENIDKLDELERRMLEREIARRIENDQGVYGALGDFFGSQETGTIDELLRRYYNRLVVLERRVDNLGRRNAIMDDVIKETETLRGTLAPLAEALEAAVSESEQGLEARTALVRAALLPAQAPTIFADYKEKTGRDLDPAAVPGLPKEGKEEELRQAREAVVQSLLTDWAMVAGYRAWQQQLKDELAPLGGVETRVAAYRSLKVELETNKQELLRTIARLGGYAPSELQNLVATGDPLREDDRRRYELGEIGLLQMERRHLLTWSVAESIVSLIVIPFLAIVLILVTRRVTNRMIARATRTDATGDAPDVPLSAIKKREREERAKTLFGIVRKAATGLILILAGIYMLKVVNIDVTPIIASLGIFGLAIAFGAQAIMKDVFSGFFILMENQMNRGDWVTIGGKVGQVEDLGLRLTVVRDLSCGDLHYIPNGQIGLVSSSSKEWGRARVNICTDFSADPETVLDILRQTAQEMQADPQEAKIIKAVSVKDGIFDFEYDKGLQRFLVAIDVWNGDTSVGWRYRIRVKKALEAAGIALAAPSVTYHQATGPHLGAAGPHPPTPAPKTT